MGRPKTRYIASLDGLRAFAVLSVIAYHLRFGWAQGGLLGVTVFFVLSGYLITGLLISEYRHSKSIDLPNFWLRRIRRLFPAVVFCVVGVLLLCVIFDHSLLTKARPDIAPSLFFYSNWWQILHDVSYFQAMGSPSPFQHFWSLGIEEQFYVVWPILLLVLFRLSINRRYLRRGILVAAAASALWMAVCYQPDVDPSRVYYGTDTRAFSLLIGAWLAFAWPSTELDESSGQNMSRRMCLAFDAVGVAAFCGLVALVVFANGYSPFLYRGGILLCSLLTAVLIAVLVHPRSMFARFWSLKPLVWVGKRSYGMYLWHFPLLLFTTDANAVGGPNPLWALVQTALIFAVSAFSFHFIEDPIRHGAIGKWVGAVKRGELRPLEWAGTHIVPVVASVAVVAVTLGGCALIPDSRDTTTVERLRAANDAAVVKAAAEAQRIEEEREAADDYSVLMIGDSVLLTGQDQFFGYFPDGWMDAEISRAFSAAQGIYDGYRDRGVVGDKVVFCLGTNGAIAQEDIDALVADIGPDKQIWFVNNRVPEDWMDYNNELLASAAARYGNVNLIDWYAYSENEGDWFDGDGTHPKVSDVHFYLELISDSIGYIPPEAPPEETPEATPEADGDAPAPDEQTDAA